MPPSLNEVSPKPIHLECGIHNKTELVGSYNKSSNSGWHDFRLIDRNNGKFHADIDVCGGINSLNSRKQSRPRGLTVQDSCHQYLFAMDRRDSNSSRNKSKAAHGEHTPSSPKPRAH